LLFLGLHPQVGPQGLLCAPFCLGFDLQKGNFKENIFENMTLRLNGAAELGIELGCK